MKSWHNYLDPARWMLLKTSVEFVWRELEYGTHWVWWDQFLNIWGDIPIVFICFYSLTIYFHCSNCLCTWHFLLIKCVVCQHLQCKWFVYLLLHPRSSNSFDYMNSTWGLSTKTLLIMKSKSKKYKRNKYHHNDWRPPLAEIEPFFNFLLVMLLNGPKIRTHYLNRAWDATTL